jgi:Ca2+-binding RTX toxin-like protein
MTTGTEGPDLLTNNPTVVEETIDALGGDDIITITNTLARNQFEFRRVTVDGGAGVDTLRVSETYLDVGLTFVSIIHDIFGVALHLYSEFIGYTGVERLVLSGNTFGGGWTTGDTIDELHLVGSRGQASTTVSSGGGDDSIYIGNVGFGSRVFAGTGNDLVDLSGFHGGFVSASGDEGNDTLLGSTGSDRLDGGTGDDAMSGGLGDDTYVVDSAGDTITEAAGGGVDSVETSLALYTLAANVENLSAPSASFASHDFTLNAADNRVSGARGTDVVRAQHGGNDSVFGQEGDDILFFGAAFTGADTADGGAGRDAVILQGNYTLTLSATNLAGIESLSLQSGATTKWGDLANNFYDYAITTNDANVAAGQQLIVNAQSLRQGEDLIFDGSAETDGQFLVFGGHGSDRLKGGSGADTFVGGGGEDLLTGGGGADTFRYDSSSDSTSNAMDQVLDFTAGSDRVDLSRIDADTLTGGDQAFHWIGSSGFSGSGAASAGELRAYVHNLVWFVEGDTNGDGRADFVLALFQQGPTPLSQADVLL